MAKKQKKPWFEMSVEERKADENLKERNRALRKESNKKRGIYIADEIPHLWAHQVQEEAHTESRSFYFFGKTIYSYGSHFPIATWLKHPELGDSEYEVLFTTREWKGSGGWRGYSTSDHKHMVYKSLPPKTKVIYGRDLDESERWNLDQWVRDATEFAEKEMSALYYGYQSHIENILERMLEYDARFKVSAGPYFERDYPKIVRLLDAAQDYLADTSLENYAWVLETLLHDSWMEILNTKSYILDKLEKKARRIKERNRQLSPEEETVRENKRRKAREAKEAKLREKNQQAYEDWINSVPWSRFPDKSGFPVSLRREGDVVRTSMGSVVPIEDARRLFNFVVGILNKKFPPYECPDRYAFTDTERAGCFKIGHYYVDRITEEGFLHAGCHHIPWSEIERFAKKESWL